MLSYRRSRSNPFLQLAAIFGSALASFAAVAWGAWTILHWLFAFVPPGHYAGLIKLAIVFGSLLTWGGLAIAAAVLIPLGVAALVVAIVE